jgi:hypothetical protein
VPPRFLVFVALALLFGCAHKVALHTTEPDAYIHVDGISLGKAPVTFEEQSGIPQTYQFAVTKEGHLPNYVELKQSHVNFPTHAFATVAPLPVMVIGGLLWQAGGPGFP